VLDVGDGFVNALAFSPDSRGLAVAAKDRLTVWDVATRARLPWDDAREAFAVAFSPDGKWVAAAEAKVVRLRDATTGRVEREFVGNSARVNALAFDRTGTRLVTGASDRRVQVWDVASGRELLSLTGVVEAVTAVAWDGERIFALDDAVRVWSAVRGE
jgi:WD40 repeat protein